MFITNFSHLTYKVDDFSNQEGPTCYANYKYEHVLYEGACNPATAAEIVRPTSDVRPTERVDH